MYIHANLVDQNVTVLAWGIDNNDSGRNNNSCGGGLTAGLARYLIEGRIDS